MQNFNNTSGVISNQPVQPIQPPIPFRNYLETASHIGGSCVAGATIYEFARKTAEKTTIKARQECEDLHKCMEFTRQNNADFEANRITSSSWAASEIIGGVTKAKILHPEHKEICKIAIPIPKRVDAEDVSHVHQAVIEACPTTHSQIGNRAQPFASASMSLTPRPPVVSKVLTNEFIGLASFTFFVAFSSCFGFLVIRDLLFPPKQNQKENLFDFSYKFQLEERLEKMEKQLEKTSLFSITLQLSEKIETGTLTKEKAESLLRKFSFSEEQISFILS